MKYSKHKTKSSRRAKEVSKFRKDLVKEVCHCEICCEPSATIVPHEIASGTGNRQQALDKRFAILVVCSECHRSIHAHPAHWTKERQLAHLFMSRPKDLDVKAYCELTGHATTAITESDVQLIVDDIKKEDACVGPHNVSQMWS